MNAPGPALRQLYRQAATPARWLAQLRQADTLLERFEFDPRRAGLDAETTLEPLLTPVSLDAALGGARLAGGVPAAARSDQPDRMDAWSRPPRSGLDKAEPTDRLPVPQRPGTASVQPDLARSTGPTSSPDRRFDPQSHPRLALLQTLARVDLPSLQRRYGLLDPAAPDATPIRPPTRTAPKSAAPQHSAADAQAWLRTLARRAHAPEAADQPLAARSSPTGHAGHSPDWQPRPLDLRAAGSSALSADTPAAHRSTPERADRTPAEPLDAATPALGGLQRLLQRFDPAHAATPSATSADAAASAATAVAGSQRSAGLVRRTGDSDLADTRHPAAATAAALRTELRHSTAPGRDASVEALADPARQLSRQDRRALASHPDSTAAASASPTWTAPIGGFRGLAALGRATESGAATPPTETATPRQPFGPSADALRDGIDAEQLAELLRQQARRHGIDLTEFEP